MSNILNIGKSALNAAQIGIATTGHNIANASTPGFHRQETVQVAAKSQNYGYGFLGQGTSVTSIQRVFNETLTRQVLRATAENGASSAYYSQVSEINDLLSNEDAGLSPVISEFFSAVSAASADPSDIASRQTLLSTAQSLVDRFSSVNRRLDNMRDNINSQISSTVDMINSYAEKIKVLNTTISRALGSTGNSPNDLMDQRDELVRKLSEQIQTTVITQTDGTYNVFIGSGTPLVIGDETYALYAVDSDTDSSRIEIATGDADDPKIMNSEGLKGGILGGILKFRSETLDKVQNQLGQLAVTIASQFNSQHKNGFDLNGDAGGNVFTIGNPVTTSSAYNTDSSKTASATITDVSQLTSSNYSLKYVNSQYVITRLDDDTIMYQGNSLPQTVDGVEINVNTSSPTEGDEYLIKPTQYAASDLTLAIENVEDFAFAGSATTGESDNENGLLLAALQNAANVRIIGSGTSRTYAQAFALIVSGVGNKTNEMNIVSKADATNLEHATAAVQSESGVNLDEEATDLLRYQQAYQAAGKMMQLASQLFDTLLQMGQ